MIEGRIDDVGNNGKAKRNFHDNKFKDHSGNLFVLICFPEDFVVCDVM